MRTRIYLLSVIVAAAGLWSCNDDPDNGKLTDFLDVNVKFTGTEKPTAGDQLHVWLYETSEKAIAAGESDNAISHTLEAEDISAGIMLTLRNVRRSDSKYILAWVDTNGDETIGTGDFAAYYSNALYDYVQDGAQTPSDVGSNYVIDLSLSMKVGSAPTGDVVDVDGNRYNSVVIGGQTWLAENLRTTRFRDGTSIQTGFSAAEWISTMIRDGDARGSGTPGYSENPQADIFTDGLYYNWFAAASPRGLCPEGWRVPSEIDWEILETYLGMTPEQIDRYATYTGGEVNAGNRLKAQGFGSGTNETGFSVIPSGERNKDTGGFVDYGEVAFFWASTDGNTSTGNLDLMGERRLFKADEAGISRYRVSKVCGASIRCIKDDEVTISLTVTTTFTGDQQPGAGSVMNTYLYFTDPTGQPFGDLTPDMTQTTTLTASDVLNGVDIVFQGIDPEQRAVYVASWVDIDGDATVNDGDYALFYRNVTLEMVESGDASPTDVSGLMGISFEHKNPLGSVLETGTVADVEGNQYRTVKIGTQTWMSENLRVTKFANGDDIKYIANDAAGQAEWLTMMIRSGDDNGTGTPAWGRDPQYFPEQGEQLTAYGYHYNWFALVDPRGLCPDGWHVPSDSDWAVLEKYAGMDDSELIPSGTTVWRGASAEVGKALKSISMGGTDAYGFSALPAGMRNKDTGAFTNGLSASDPDVYFWTSDVYAGNVQQGWRRLLRTSRSEVNRSIISKEMGGLVRCVMD